MDPIADYLTCIRNAQKAAHPVVEVKSSSMKKKITEILCDQGYIQKYEFHDDLGPQGTIKIFLKYAPKTKKPAILDIKRVSKPSRRVYKQSKKLTHVLNGLGIGIISTPKGVMTDKKARREGIGGKNYAIYIKKIMSRIGNQAISIPKDVRVHITSENVVEIQGPKGVLVQKIDPCISVTQQGDQLLVARTNEDKKTKSMHGLYRALLCNKINGVTSGYKKSLQVVGLSYKASVENNVLMLSLGKSHLTYIKMPEGISIALELVKGKRTGIYLHVEGIDKALVGEVASKIRAQRPPEPYVSKRGNTQKGIRYVDEVLIGKTKKDGN